MAITDARRALKEARALFSPEGSIAVLTVWDDEPKSEVRKRVEEAERAGVETIVLAVKFRPCPGDEVWAPAPIAHQSVPAPRQAPIAPPPAPLPPPAVDRPPEVNPVRPHTCRTDMLTGRCAIEGCELAPNQRVVSHPAADTAPIPFHVCQISPLTGWCNVVAGCPTRSAMMEPRPPLRLVRDDRDSITLGGSRE